MNHHLEQTDAANVVDLLGRWLELELERGELRAFLELALARDAGVRHAHAKASILRRTHAIETMTQVSAVTAAASSNPQTTST